MFSPSSLDSHSDIVQLIDESKNFSTSINDFLHKVKLNGAGLDYHIVSVFGSQSTGKSTLLNALFNTDFDVMSEIKRQQTTKGIWMARAQTSSRLLKQPSPDGEEASSEEDTTTDQESKILVMDVEGTDGRERGDDQDFERKSALFALATSEVIIINIWEHQVGLYQGANMALLKTVFEVNLSLFKDHQSKSLILFVIRDHIGVTPLSNLSNTLTADLNRIWESLSKPADMVDPKLDEFFDLQFTALPHKILQPEQFSSGTSNLGTRFTDPDNSEYVFKKKYHRNVPIDGWSFYAGNVWQQIELNKDLDLPTQQILVARFRCDEIANQSWDLFEQELLELKKHIDAKLQSDKEIDENFLTVGNLIKHTRSSAMLVFDEFASKYAKAVYETKRKELLSRIDSELINIYKNHLTKLLKLSLVRFETKFAENLSKNLGFLVSIDSSELTTKEFFLSNANNASADDGVFVFDDEFTTLDEEINKIKAIRRNNEISKIISRAMKKIKPVLSEKIKDVFKNPNEDTWDRIYDEFNSISQMALSRMNSSTITCDTGVIDFGVGAYVEDNQKGVLEFKKQAWINFEKIIKGDVCRPENVLNRLLERFDELFRFDENGAPIVWKPSDNIEAVYLKAKNNALLLLPIFCEAKLKDGTRITPGVSIAEEEEDNLKNERDFNDFDLFEIEKRPFSAILTDKQKEEISNKFKKQCDLLYIESKRSTIQSITQIPIYVYALIIILGWNEFMAILRNPVYTLFLLLAGGGAYIIHSLKLWSVIINVTDAMFLRVKDMAVEKLQDMAVNSDTKKSPIRQQVSVRASSGGSDHYSDNIELDDFNEQEN
ncbi:protein SEY1 [Nadsonia fulvescens var. elongata DSM 6958]|uniref:Protein SEY1 n=1 Tax=Nadsonia fulvescens var. elongata DSM 6958 TaxID=857566 RepID=A0A1E3PT14_9ASCO|nr:protein SEY1 [Nadsonia fulvescens var. elongata DSM 6958]